MNAELAVAPSLLGTFQGLSESTGSSYRDLPVFILRRSSFRPVIALRRLIRRLVQIYHVYYLYDSL